MSYRIFQSSTGRAYTWYVNLKLVSVRDFEHLVSLFNTKFFCVEAKFFVAKLGRIRQYPGEDLDTYEKRKSDKVMESWI